MDLKYVIFVYVLRNIDLITSLYHKLPAPEFSPITTLGLFLLLVSPVPSCPLELKPQQLTPPPVSTAQVW